MSRNFTAVDTASLTIRALKNSLRQRIIELLEEEEKMTVTDLYIKLRIEQSIASQALAILRRGSIVETKNVGKFVYYSVNKPVLDAMLVLCGQFPEHGEKRKKKKAVKV